MNPEQHYTDLQDLMNNDFLGVLSACPNWYSEPARAAIDTMLATIASTLADHKAAKQAQG